MARYPEVRLDVALSDAVVDLLDDRSDVAIRTGPLQDSRLVRRRLGASRLVVVAAPSYLEREGVPKKPQDLAERRLLGFAYARHVEDWSFKGKQGTVAITPTGNLRLGDGESMRQMAMAGTGIARLARFHVDDDIQAGRLVPLLESYNPGDTEEIHAVFIGPGKQVPARVRVLLDFFADKVRIGVA